MNEHEKAVVESLKEMLPNLNEIEKAYLLGFIEGMAARKEFKSDVS